MEFRRADSTGYGDVAGRHRRQFYRRERPAVRPIHFEFEYELDSGNRFVQAVKGRPRGRTCRYEDAGRRIVKIHRPIGPVRRSAYGMLCNDFLWHGPSRWTPFRLFFRGSMKTDRMEGTMISITRRSVLRGAIAAAAGAFAGRAVLAPTRVFAQARPGASAEGVK